MPDIRGSQSPFLTFVIISSELKLTVASYDMTRKALVGWVEPGSSAGWART